MSSYQWENNGPDSFFTTSEMLSTAAVMNWNLKTFFQPSSQVLSLTPARERKDPGWGWWGPKSPKICEVKECDLWEG